VTLVRIERVPRPHVNKRGILVNRSRKRFIVLCDSCHAEFTYGRTSFDRKTHYCSRECRDNGLGHGGAAFTELTRTSLLRYGHEHPTKSPSVQKKRHDTMKRRGLYGASKVEDEFYRSLAQVFDRVERQVSVNTWQIDFRIVDLDLYVQFDGVYWHGLDRPLSVISEVRSPRDRKILYKWNVDRRQDSWFQQQNLRLLRVTDVQFTSSAFGEIVERMRTLASL
jgi:hypothetical protein